jgi:hypothetical protein
MSKNKLENAIMKLHYESDLPMVEHNDELMKKLFQKAKSEIPKINNDPHADSFKMQEEFEESALAWFERWFGK